MACQYVSVPPQGSDPREAPLPAHHVEETEERPGPLPHQAASVQEPLAGNEAVERRLTRQRAHLHVLELDLRPTPAVAAAAPQRARVHAIQGAEGADGRHSDVDGKQEPREDQRREEGRTRPGHRTASR